MTIRTWHQDHEAVSDLSQNIENAKNFKVCLESSYYYFIENSVNNFWQISYVNKL